MQQYIFVLAVLATIYPVTGYSQGAGQLEFAVGNVNVIATNGYPRSLRKGAEINSGDTVVTGDNGRAQVRFSDGGYISLQSNTRFRIDEYRYQGSTDGNQPNARRCCRWRSFLNTDEEEADACDYETVQLVGRG